MSSLQPSSSAQPSLSAELRGSLLRYAHPVLLLALMWVLRAADAILPGSFNSWGIRAWDPTSVLGLVLSPVLHSGWGHLLANSVPFLVLGLLVAGEGVRRFWTVTAIIALIGGAGTWVVNLPGTVTVGASGLVFGYFGYLLVRALFVRSLAHRVLYGIIALAVLVVYGGSMLIGVLPVFPGVSWQGHLFGAVGGALAAWLMGRSGSVAERSGITGR